MNGFFKISDECLEKLGKTVMTTRRYWSRKYEYAFAIKFAEKNDVVLDAACGTFHPLKFALAEICKTYACDLEDAHINEKIIFTKCNIASMPYEDAMFDKVFCISALEHMNLKTITAGVCEFMRVLKPNGTLVITIDYPTLDPHKLLKILDEAGFISDESAFDKENAVTSETGLICYHIKARKKA